MDLVLERVKLRPSRHPPIHRRLSRAKRPADRVPRQARPPRQLLDRHAPHEMLPTQLGPQLHVQQDLPPDTIAIDRARLDPTPDDSAPPKGVTFQPAEEGQYSAGADILPLGRNRAAPLRPSS